MVRMAAGARARRRGWTGGPGERLVAQDAERRGSGVDEVGQVGLAQALVAQDAERLVEDVGDVVELTRELAAKVGREPRRRYLTAGGRQLQRAAREGYDHGPETDHDSFHIALRRWRRPR